MDRDGQPGNGSCEVSKEILIGQVVNLFREIVLLTGRQNMGDMLKLDLTMPQLKVMTILLHGGPTSVGTLASTLGVSLPTVTGILDRLVDRGLILRCESLEDRRLVINQLTDTGAATIIQLRQAGLEKASNVLRRLSAQDLGELAYALDRLHSAAEQEFRNQNRIA